MSGIGQGEAPEGFAFGDVQVDLRRMMVFRAGQPVALEPKSFDVLRVLVEHRDRLVGKDELLDIVWKDVFVTPNVLTRAVAQIRKALGDEAKDSRYIETASKRGYRFIAPVTVLGPEQTQVSSHVAGPDAVAPVRSDPPAAELRPNWRVGGAVAGAVLLAVIGLAVWWREPTSPPPLPTITRLTSSGDVIDSAISPDGKFVVYVRSSGGRQSLWIRQVQDANAVELVAPAPVGYWGVTFSPDGAEVFYGVKGAPPLANPAGTLYVTSALPGAPPRAVLTGIDSTVTFSPDGRRLAFFRIEPDGSGASSLVVAQRDGTGARVVATRRPPEFFAPGFFVAPSWSPDGRRIVAPVRDERSVDSRLETFDPDGRSADVLQAGFGREAFTMWMPDGKGILFTGYARGDWTASAQLWLRPYPVGEPRRITANPVAYRNASVSADGRTIVTVGADPAASLWVVPTADAGGAHKLPSMRGDGIGGSTWVGDRIVFAGFETGEPQLWSIRPDGSDRRQLTSDGWSAWPRSSPDGRTIYFVSFRGGRSGIWRMDADGGGNTRLLAQVFDPERLVVTPDGEWIYFNAFTRAEFSTWRMPSAGGMPQLVLRGLSRTAISPDGRRLAGIWRASPQAPLVLAVIPIAGGPPSQTFPGPYVVSGFGGVEWTRDGRGLLFTTAERTNVWRQPLGGGAPARLTGFAEGAVFGFAQSPDGAQLVVSSGGDIRDAFLVTGFR